MTATVTKQFQRNWVRSGVALWFKESCAVLQCLCWVCKFLLYVAVQGFMVVFLAIAFVRVAFRVPFMVLWGLSFRV